MCKGTVFHSNAAAFIDTSTARQEEGGEGGGWISELVDGCYRFYEQGVLPGEGELRSDIIEMAAKPFFQHDAPSITELRKQALHMRKQDRRGGNPSYDIKSEKQIRKLLSVVGNR